MPAINPSVLDKKIQTIFDRPLDTDAFPGEIHALLSFYADRTKRSTAATATQESADLLHVPAAVLRALCTKIHQRGQREGDRWLDAAERLWASGLREMRQVSICLLSEAPAESTLETAGRWAAGCDDPLVLQALAAEGLRSWRESEPEKVYASAVNWLANEATRAFGLMALQRLIEENSFDNLPSIFNALVGLPSTVRGFQQQSLLSLMEALAERSPAETTAFLLDELSPDDHRAARLVRAALDAFPAPFQAQLRQAL
ncbi:MAG: DNA alkylation repair protein [Anaerolineales bacterium]|nr:DNA alkylation repair protein [Anaerolineales bacterium]